MEEWMTSLAHQIIIDFVAGIWENLGTNNLIWYVFSSQFCNVYLTLQNSYVPTSQATKETVSFPQTSTSPRLWYLLSTNRPLALRGHMTNASFKQWVGILLMPKIDKVHKSYLIPEIWEETHLRETYYGTLIFQQSTCSMICIGCHVGGHTLTLQHGGQNYFLLVSCWTFASYAQMCCKRYHIIFSTFSLKFKCKISVQKEVIHSFKNHILVTWPARNLLILRKWCRFEKLNHYYFV